MILVDANLLIYAHVQSFTQHARARSWLDARLGSGGGVALPWASLVAFVRIVTNPRVFERPEPIADAWRQVEAWLDADAVWVPEPGERHRSLLAALLAVGGMRANLVPDAHLAAIAVEHGLLLCSTDGDFARFPGLRWQDPLRD
jgi:uncharacterized protein